MRKRSRPVWAPRFPDWLGGKTVLVLALLAFAGAGLLRGCQGRSPLPEVATFDLPGAYSVAFSADGKLIAAGSAERPGKGSKIETGTIKVWELESRNEIATWSVPRGVRALAFSADSTELVAVTCACRAAHHDFHDNKLKIADVRQFDIANGNEKNVLSLQAPIVSVVIAPDATHVAFAGGLLEGNQLRGLIKLVDARILTQKWAINIDDQVHPAIAFSPDGKTLAVANYRLKQSVKGMPAGESVVELRDVADGHKSSALKVQSGPIATLFFGPDGRSLGVLADQFQKWDLTSEKRMAAPFLERALSAGWYYRELTVSRDGRWLASLTIDDDGDSAYSTLLAWDAHQEKPILTAAAPTRQCYGLAAFSPDCRFLAVTQSSMDQSSPERLGGVKLCPLPE